MTQATEDKPVTGALEKVKVSPNDTPKSAGAGTLQTLLKQYQDQIATALPRHLTPERMIRVAMTAVTTTPALHECSILSIAACIVQSAVLGLEPSSLLGEAYLVPFNNTKTKRKECQLIPGYLGLLKLARQSGEISTVQANVVYAKDTFAYEYGLDPYMRHVPHGGSPSERGPAVAYYACAKLKDGGSQFTVMTVPEVHAHRNKYSAGWKSQGASSTWGKEEEAMALKTCIRKLCKLLPKSIEKPGQMLQTAIGMDERAESSMAQRFSVEVPLELQPAIDDEPEAEPIQQPKRASEVAKESGAAAKVADQPTAEEEDAIAVQKANIKRKLLAAPVVDELPDCMEIPIGDIRKYKGKFWTPNQDKSGWTQYPVPEGVTL